MSRAEARDRDGQGQTAPDPRAQKEKVKAMVATAAVFLGIALAISYLLASLSSSRPCSSYPFEQQQANCVMETATATHNISGCDALPMQQQQQQCIADVSMAEKNASGCTLINATSSWYQECITSLSRFLDNFSYCGSLPYSLAVQCIYNVSEGEGFSSASGCGVLENGTYATVCRTMYYYEKAASSRNGAYCSALGTRKNNTETYAVGYAMERAGTNFSASSQDMFYLVSNATPEQYCSYAAGICKLYFTSGNVLACQQ